MLLDSRLQSHCLQAAPVCGGDTHMHASVDTWAAVAVSVVLQRQAAQ